MGPGQSRPFFRLEVVMAALLAPLLSTMSKAARTAWPFIERGVREGMGANAIQDALREAGAGIRRQDLLALVREAQGAELLRSDVRRLPRDLIMPVERVREAITRVVAPFGYTVEVTAVEAETGVERRLTLTAHSNELRALEEVETEFVDMTPEDYPLPGFVIVEARVTDVYRSGAAGVI